MRNFLFARVELWLVILLFLFGLIGMIGFGVLVLDGERETKRFGALGPAALEVAEQLADEAEVEVLDLRTLVPLDTETVLESVRKTGRLLVVDEDYHSFGVSGEIIARATEGALSDLSAVGRVTMPDAPIPYARPLEQAVNPGTEDIVEAIRGLAGDVDK